MGLVRPALVVGIGVSAGLLGGMNQASPSTGHVYLGGEVMRAVRNGVIPADRYEILQAGNPYYLRGDFNGDGHNDVCVWVRDQGSDSTGLAFLFYPFNALRLVGAGFRAEDAQLGAYLRPDSEVWYVRAKGSTDTPYNSIPEIGVHEGEPFVFPHESVEIQSATWGLVLLWQNGVFHVVWTID